MINVVAEYIRNENTRSFEEENALFSIIADEVTFPHGNQEIMCLRMLVCCKVKEFFFMLYTLRRQQGKL